MCLALLQPPAVSRKDLEAHNILLQLPTAQRSRCLCCLRWLALHGIGQSAAAYLLLQRAGQHSQACAGLLLTCCFRESDDTAAERPQQACSHSMAAAALPEEAQKGRARSWWCCHDWP